MAKSKAKKLRDKQMREGNRNPELNRGVFALADMRSRKTATKQEKLQKQLRKERLSSYENHREEKRSFYFV